MISECSNLALNLFQVLLDQLLKIFQFFSGQVVWQGFVSHVLEHSYGHLLLAVVLTQLFHMFSGFSNPLRDEVLLVHVLALIYHRCILIFLNHLLGSLRIWPDLWRLRIKRTRNYSTCLNTTKSSEFTHLFYDTLLPFREGCLPCQIIRDIGKFHLLPSHGYNNKESNKKL